MAVTASDRSTADDPAVTVAFVVTIDDKRLGAFSKCEGLGVEIVTEQREEGGQNSFVHVLPTRIKYPTIKLTRPLTADTATVAAWVSSVMHSPGARPTATIVAMRTNGSIVCRWSLAGVVPVRWTGPQFDLESAKAATETLEIAHHGFLDGRGT